MKNTRFLAACLSLGCGIGALGGDPAPVSKKPVDRPRVFTAVAATNSPTAVSAAETSPTSAATFQPGTVSSRPPLISREQAQTVLERFKRGYAKLSSPRMVLFVNRELVDESAGLKLTERREKSDALKSDFTAEPNVRPAGQLGANVTIVGNVGADGTPIPGKGTSERVTSENTYRIQDPKSASVADRQTVRDIERLFGRPLRTAGARLADQRVAAQLLEGHRVQDVLVTAGGVNAARDREALLKVADVVVEILISSRSVTVPAVSGDAVYQAPDIQATAIRVQDAQVLGQASSTDILGPDRAAGRVLRTYDVREITEATAFALMEDMMQGVTE